MRTDLHTESPDVGDHGEKPVGNGDRDDPADHRGVLSWHSQPRDKYMSEAGSSGYLVKADVPLDAVKAGEPVVIRLSVPEDCDGGLAIYGKDFGRYPLDPSLVFTR